MKQLLVMRHAKSSWKNPNLPDFDRPLNPRGKRDAPRMGRWLLEHDLVPEQILCSAACRAYQTAQLLVLSLGADIPMIAQDDLYHASPATWCETLRQLPEHLGTILIVGHNPELEALVEQLSGDWRRMPTAAIAHLVARDVSWQDLPKQGAQLVSVATPKGLAAEWTE